MKLSPKFNNLILFSCNERKSTLNTLDYIKPHVIKFMQYAMLVINSKQVSFIKICGSKINYKITMKSNGSISSK